MSTVIDVHAHFLPRAVIAARDSGGSPWHGTDIEIGPRGNPVFHSGRVTTSVYAPSFWQSPADRIADMDRIGVDMQFVSLAPPLYRYFIDARPAIDAAREVNDELGEWTRDFGERFRGLATLPLQDPAASVAELGRAVEELGLVGAAVGTHVDGTNWDDERLLPVLSAAHELGAVILFHPAEMRGREALPRYQFPNLIGNPFETTQAIASLIFGGVLDRLPLERSIFVHGGGFACANVGRFDHGYRSRDAARGAARLPSEYLQELHYDCITHDERSLRYLIDVAGSDRVVLGSDYPADMGLIDPRGWIEGMASLTDDEKRAVLGDNARRLAHIGER